MPIVGPTPSSREDAVFETTHWSLVRTAAETGKPAAPAALDRLCALYWPALHAFLCRKGYSAPEAEDLVQGFFEHFLAGEYLRSVAPDKGRFRSFLLASLRHFVANEQRDRRTQRRGGGNLHIALPLNGNGNNDSAESRLRTEPTPEELFDRNWGETIIREASRQLRDEYERRGRLEIYSTIRTWLAREVKPGEYATAAERLRTTEGAIAAAAHRMRNRFRELVRREVAQTVQSPGEIADEMRYLLRVLTVQ